VNIDRQRQQDPRVRRCASLQQQRRNQPFVAAQRIVGVQHRPHPVGQLVAPLLAATMGDTVGKSGRQQRMLSASG
jgi:hypothetical protein